MQKIGKMIEEESVHVVVRAKKDPKKSDTVDNITKINKKIDINIVANNFEKYMSFRLGKHLQFIDSFQFLSQSLDRLSSNLSEDRFIYTGEEIEGARELDLMKKKGVYPYDYMDSFSRFNEISLPKREDFYSILNDTDISEDDYKHAQEVWDAFAIRNLGEYHDLYLKTDILLLADVFENLRETCLHDSKLDPCHYMSSPGLYWEAIHKMTKINLDLICDIDMQLFIEKGLRRGISYIAHRHVKANNKYIRDYNLEEENSYLMYLDANNLYGRAMSQPLPYSDLKWLDFKDPDEIILDNYHENSNKGIILEVDLEYPEELHDLHNDYPCAPEKIVVTNDMLSDYCQNIKNLQGNSSGNVSKLIPTLGRKNKYVLHYRNLKLHLDLGLCLTKIQESFRIQAENLVKTLY